MVDGVAAFAEDVSRRFPETSTAVHYVSDVRVFLRWFGRPLDVVQRTDIDTMTQDRVYRKSSSPKEALGEIQRQAGAQFDPGIVPVFCRVAASGIIDEAATRQDLHGSTLRSLDPASAHDADHQSIKRPA